MKKGGNISIKLTNILKQTQECCNKKKCPKGTKRCKPTKKGKRKKDDVGMFGGMPNIRPTSRAIPMPQSVMNNITPVPNIPLPRQLPAYSQFRRPHAMYQRNDRPLQVQQGRGVRQPQTKTRGVMTDRERRGSQGTADQPFNFEGPTPNILDYEGLLMRNAEEDRRLAQRRREQMSERFKSTLKDIGQGTPREEGKDEGQQSPEVLFSDVTEDESDEEALTQQIESVKQLIGEEEVAMNQGFVEDRLAERQRRDIDDEPIRRGRGRPTTEEDIERAMREEVAERRQKLEEEGVDTSGYTTDDIFRMSDEEITAGASFV